MRCAGLRAARRSCRGNVITEYLIVLIALAAIWFTSDVILNAVNTYYGGFSAVIAEPAPQAETND